jgi:hypothetical protein
MECASITVQIPAQLHHNIDLHRVVHSTVEQSSFARGKHCCLPAHLHLNANTHLPFSCCCLGLPTQMYASSASCCRRSVRIRVVWCHQLWHQAGFLQPVPRHPPSITRGRTFRHRVLCLP